MMVGVNAPSNSPPGAMPSWPKAGERIDWPAGFGALAMTVNPPPITAPETTAYCSEGEKPGTSTHDFVSSIRSLPSLFPERGAKQPYHGINSK
jgi:hypothetical protein